jgi:hypothetical protein
VLTIEKTEIEKLTITDTKTTVEGSGEEVVVVGESKDGSGETISE